MLLKEKQTDFLKLILRNWCNDTYKWTTQCKTGVSALLRHWRYHSLGLNYRNSQSNKHILMFLWKFYHNVAQCPYGKSEVEWLDGFLLGGRKEAVDWWCSWDSRLDSWKNILVLISHAHFGQGTHPWARYARSFVSSKSNRISYCFVLSNVMLYLTAYIKSLQ